MADTTGDERPTAEQLAEIAVQTAGVARRMGHEPRVAFCLFDLRQPDRHVSRECPGRGRLLDGRDTDFEYEGEMAPDVALNPTLQSVYPFSRLTGPANVLVMPASSRRASRPSCSGSWAETR
jgi:malate dehydrogenase (oxaloacetate-decarboxylating)(NADP+)